MRRTQPLLKAGPLRSSIIHLQEAHRKELIDFGRKLDGEEEIHDVEGSNETDLFALLQPLEGEVHIVKCRYSGFVATDLDLLLRTIGVQTVLLMGQLTMESPLHAIGVRMSRSTRHEQSFQESGPKMTAVAGRVRGRDRFRLKRPGHYWSFFRCSRSLKG